MHGIHMHGIGCLGLVHVGADHAAVCTCMQLSQYHSRLSHSGRGGHGFNAVRGGGRHTQRETT